MMTPIEIIVFILTNVFTVIVSFILFKPELKYVKKNGSSADYVLSLVFLITFGVMIGCAICIAISGYL